MVFNLDNHPLIGKTVYEYSAYPNEFHIRKKRITNVVKQDGKTFAEIDTHLKVETSLIDNPAVSNQRTYYSFERNDTIARQVLYSGAKVAFSNYMENMMKQIDEVRKNYTQLFEMISSGEIQPDMRFWEEESPEIHPAPQNISR